MPVIPQARIPLANGRSSDFILIRCAIFPEISKLHPSDSVLTPVTLLATHKKGLTASGNVADSHRIPILAPSPHQPKFDVGENQMRCKGTNK